jgi:hypothetical protein
VCGLPQVAAAKRRFAKCRILREKLVATKKMTSECRFAVRAFDY